MVAPFFSMEAHPRSRGENSGACWTGTLIFGSSPLTRGKRFNPVAVLIDQGLIPAHAGKTRFGTAFVSSAAAHPRSRGENFGDIAGEFAANGSSPLTRGKPTSLRASRARARLIPAHAGKTSSGIASSPRARAHPRSRGENLASVLMLRSTVGSSPLTRGKPLTGRAGSVR